MKKYGLVIWLMMVVVTMAVVKWRYGSSRGEEVVQITPTPTPIMEPTTSIKEEDYPLWKLLPYSGVGFTVDRYIEPLTLVVLIKGLDKQIVTEEIGKWMEENGVNPETHKIVISNQ